MLIGIVAFAVFTFVLGFLSFFVPGFLGFNETLWDVQVQEQNKVITKSSEEIKLNRKDAKAYFNRGEAYLVIEKYDKAILDFNKVIEINPKFARAYEGRADAYLGLAYRGLDKIDKIKIDSLILLID